MYGMKPLLYIFRAASRFVGRFAPAASGVAAIEFAFIAAPFLALTIAILETGLVFFAQQDLQAATSRAARLIMTGQAQAESMTMNQFVEQVCTDAALFSCGSLYVNAQRFSTFSSVTMTNPVTKGNFSNSDFVFETGGPGDIIVVQVFYLWPVIGGPLSFSLSNVDGGYHLLVGTAAFRNEPS